MGTNEVILGTTELGSAGRRLLQDDVSKGQIYNLKTHNDHHC